MLYRLRDFQLFRSTWRFFFLFALGPWIIETFYFFDLSNAKIFLFDHWFHGLGTVFRVFFCQKILQRYDDVVYAPMFDQHLLVVAPALARRSCFDDFAHLGMNTPCFPIIDRHFEDRPSGDQKVNIFFLLIAGPVISAWFLRKLFWGMVLSLILLFSSFCLDNLERMAW